MLQFLQMLKGGQGNKGTQAGPGSAGQAGGQSSGFFQALGADKMGQSAKQGQGVGAQMGLGAAQLPEVPNMMSMVNGMQYKPQQNYTQQATNQINPLLQMLMNGGR